MSQVSILTLNDLFSYLFALVYYRNILLRSDEHNSHSSSPVTTTTRFCRPKTISPLYRMRECFVNINPSPLPPLPITSPHSWECFLQSWNIFIIFSKTWLELEGRILCRTWGHSRTRDSRGPGRDSSLDTFCFPFEAINIQKSYRGNKKGVKAEIQRA